MTRRPYTRDQGVRVHHRQPRTWIRRLLDLPEACSCGVAPFDQCKEWPR